MADNSYIAPLASAILTEVTAIGGKANCGINNNWLPVISRALLHGKDDPNLVMIYTMSGPPLPESMQGTPPINLLLDSVDPTHEMNDDPETKKELVKIFSKPENTIDKVLTDIANESNGCLQWIYALAVRGKIMKFLSAKDTPKPRGRPPAGCQWDGRIGSYVADAQVMSDSKGEAKADDKMVDGGKKRPAGRPPVGKVWDESAGAYVDKPNSDTELVDIPTETEKKRPVGRPPAGKVWDPAQGIYKDPSEQEAFVAYKDPSKKQRTAAVAAASAVEAAAIAEL